MENNFKDLKQFANQTQWFLNSLNLQIKEYKNTLSPEDLEKFEKEIENKNLDQLNKDLAKQTKELNELLTKI